MHRERESPGQARRPRGVPAVPPGGVLTRPWGVGGRRKRGRPRVGPAPAMPRRISRGRRQWCERVWGVCGGGWVFRRCPTLPRPFGRSTIGAGGLSFRVRDGTGRSPSAKTTDNTIKLWSNHSGCEYTHPDHTSVCVFRVAQWMQTTCHEQALGLLVPVDSTPHGASISGLSTQWSAGSLNHSRWWETSSWNELPA